MCGCEREREIQCRGEFYNVSRCLCMWGCNNAMSASVQSAEGVAQEKSFHLVSRHLVKEVISPNENVRKQVHFPAHLRDILVQTNPDPCSSTKMFMCGASLVSRLLCGGRETHEPGNEATCSWIPIW